MLIRDAYVYNYYPIVLLGGMDGRLILWYTAEWSRINVIEVDVTSAILCIDVSVDSTFLVAGAYDVSCLCTYI